jgi:hypothetical protein
MSSEIIDTSFFSGFGDETAAPAKIPSSSCGSCFTSFKTSVNDDMHAAEGRISEEDDEDIDDEEEYDEEVDSDEEEDDVDMNGFGSGGGGDEALKKNAFFSSLKIVKIIPRSLSSTPKRVKKKKY